MNTLIVPLASITAEGVTIDTVVPTATLQPADAEEVPLSAVAVQGTLTEAGEEFLFLGRISGTFEHTCDRCLEAARRELNVPVVWSYREAPAAQSDGEDNESDTLTFSGTDINLGRAVWEEIVLATPSKYLCQDDCRGLCPHCGTNWNRGACACRDTDVMENKGLAGLADVLPELRPKRSKE